MSVTVRSYVSAQRCSSVSASMSWATTRTRSSERRTLPSRIVATPNSSATVRRFTARSRYSMTEVREITFRSSTLARCARMSSCTPSLKNWLSGSWFMFVKGSTATERVSPASLRSADSPAVPGTVSIRPAVTTPSRANASTPPPMALRQVKRLRALPAPAASGASTPDSAEEAEVGSSEPCPASTALLGSGRMPSCTKAVARTMGRPITRRASANAGNHSGRPKLLARTSTT